MKDENSELDRYQEFFNDFYKPAAEYVLNFYEKYKDEEFEYGQFFNYITSETYSEVLTSNSRDSINLNPAPKNDYQAIVHNHPNDIAASSWDDLEYLLTNEYLTYVVSVTAGEIWFIKSTSFYESSELLNFKHKFKEIIEYIKTEKDKSINIMINGFKNNKNVFVRCYDPRTNETTNEFEINEWELDTLSNEALNINSSELIDDFIDNINIEVKLFRFNNPNDLFIFEYLEI